MIYFNSQGKVFRYIRHFVCLLLTAALLLAFTACGSAGTTSGKSREAAASSSESSEGNSSTSNSKSKNAPKTVVALTRSIAEMWTLAGGTLAGTTDDALDLEGAKNATSIGTIAAPDAETILGLNPDLVLLVDDMPAQKNLLTSLKEAGVHCEVVTVNSFSDYQKYMKEFTGLTGRSDLYKKNVTDVASAIDKVKSKADAKAGGSGSDSRKAAGTYLMLRTSATRNKVLTSDYFAAKIVNDLHYQNIADSDSALSDLSMEAILKDDPDVIFVVLQGDEAEAKQAYQDAFVSQPGWSDLSAVKNGRVYILPKENFQFKPNNRWGEAYSYIYDLLYSKAKS